MRLEIGYIHNCSNWFPFMSILTLYIQSLIFVTHITGLKYWFFNVIHHLYPWVVFHVLPAPQFPRSSSSTAPEARERRHPRGHALRHPPHNVTRRAPRNVTRRRPLPRLNETTKEFGTAVVWGYGGYGGI